MHIALVFSQFELLSSTEALSEVCVIRNDKWEIIHLFFINCMDEK